MRTILPYLIYPSLLVLAFGFHAALTAWWSFPTQISALLAIGACALIITLLESAIPYRKSWRPEGSEVVTDSIYLGAVQFMLPKFVMFLIATTVLAKTNASGWNIGAWWPHDLPVWIQVVMMFVIGDFFRYWLHRWMHTNPLLWRFHAVHHSPPKLYWMNVARFHPVEKIAQQLLDIGPFIILGVGEPVLAAHFIFYAVDGFLQHCNIAIRMGFLNYALSGPELHRWHHSKREREGNKNFGNHVILYDLLFGTWFLPKGRQVEELGLRETGYPQDALRQQLAPFLHKGS